MNILLERIREEVFLASGIHSTDVEQERESQDYSACRFLLNGKRIFSRNAKVTPKKAGQFVTFWKRSLCGPIAPFDELDPFDFCLVIVQFEVKVGLFVFPKGVLLQKGIISTHSKGGKRAFRVYPSWDKPSSQQALRTQKWQTDYFYELGGSLDNEKVSQLFDYVVTP